MQSKKNHLYLIMIENPHIAMANFAKERNMRIGSIPLQFPPAVARKKNIFIQVNGHT